MMDAPTAELSELTTADQEVLDRIGADALGDLCTRLGLLFGLTGTWSPVSPPQADDREGAIHCTIGIDRCDARVRIMVEAELAVAVRKAAIAAAPAAIALRPIAEALGEQPLRLSAFLGRCTLALAEFRDLAPGDVLALESRMDEPLALVINGRRNSGLCSLEQQPGAFALKILKPVTE